MRTSKPITVTLGDLQAKVDERLKSGAYSSASEVVRAGLARAFGSAKKLHSTKSSAENPGGVGRPAPQHSGERCSRGLETRNMRHA